MANVSVSMPDDLLARVDRAASSAGMNRSRYISDCLAQHLHRSLRSADLDELSELRTRIARIETVLRLPHE